MRSSTAVLLWWAAVVSPGCASSITLPNGLTARMDVGGPYDAVAISFRCPEPAAPEEAGARPLLVALLSRAAGSPGGAADRVESLGGTLAVEEVGDLVRVWATGLRGSAPDIGSAVADLVCNQGAGPPPHPRDLVAQFAGGPTATAEAQRYLLGPAWWATGDEVALAAEHLGEAGLERLRREWLVGRRGGLAATAGSEESVRGAVRPFGALESGTRADPPMVRHGGPVGEVTRSGGGRGLLVVAAAGPSPSDPSGAAWQVTSVYLGGGNEGLLFRTLRSEARLVYQAGCQWLIEEGGILWAEAHGAPTPGAPLERAMIAAIENAAAAPPSSEDAARCRRLAATRWTLDSSRPLRRAQLAAAGIAWGAGPGWLERHGRALEAVSSEDIRRVCETLLRSRLVLRIEAP